MPTNRRFALGAGALLAAVSLTFAATGASSASPSVGDATAHPSTSQSDVPDAGAPHVGRVAGMQYGSDISVSNPRSVHAFRVLHRGLISGTQAKAGPGEQIHVNVGTSFNSDTVGSQATQSVSTKIHADPQVPALYTPTMYPSGGSCIEMSTAYFPGQAVVAAWDWCQAIDFVAQVTINKRFMKTYTQNGFYSTQIDQTDQATNTWTSYLYNYKKDKWQKFFSQKGTSQVGLGEGWDIYELYSNLKDDGQSYACDDLEGKTIEAKGIKVGVGGTLVKADPTNAGHDYDQPLGNFHCDSLSYQMLTPYSHWQAIG